MNAIAPNPPQRKSYIVSIIVIFVLLSSAMIVFNTIRFLQHEKENMIGDGLHVDSYRFDLSTCLVPKDGVVPTGLPKAGMEILDYPELMPADEVDKVREEIRGKYQVSSDKIVGLNINGDIRAYPIRILQWHEVINDVVGDVPVALTYSPLSGSVVVFDRRVDGETLEFGVSGLLYNSTLVLYDRREEPSQESLWSQLQFRAISGKAAEKGMTLKTLPCTLSRWDDWKTKYPQSIIIKPNLKKIRQYQSDPYGPYQSMDNLNFAVSPQPSTDVYLNKTHIIVLRIQNQLFPIPLPLIQKAVNADNIWEKEINGLPIQIHYTPVPEMAQVITPSSSLPDDFSIIYAYHFAWFSHHPDVAYVLE